MKRTLHRLFVTLTLSGGLLAPVTTTANAGICLNHSEPVTNDR